MGFSMRLELTLVSNINDLWLVRLVYIGVIVPLLWSVSILETRFSSSFIEYPMNKAKFCTHDT